MLLTLFDLEQHTMNANPKFLSQARTLMRRRSSLADSRKVYVEGSRPDIRVPMREISQADTLPDGCGKKSPIYVYDCSGPYTTRL